MLCKEVHTKDTVLHFGLCLAPRTLSKCMHAALIPPYRQEIHILNYLDAWLICAPTKEGTRSYTEVVLARLLKLGLTQGEEFPHAVHNSTVFGPGARLCLD